MNTNMNITISDVQNANLLGEFHPVSGEWSLHCDSEDRSKEGVEQAVRNWMDSSYPVHVEVYHADGRAIGGDLPSDGTFVAIRVNSL